METIDIKQEDIEQLELQKATSSISSILTNGIIRLHVKQLREAKTQETQELLSGYSNNSLSHQELIGSSGLPPLNEQKSCTREQFEGVFNDINK